MTRLFSPSGRVLLLFDLIRLGQEVKFMDVRSAYIVQSQVISLGRTPFLVGENIRPVFRPMFASKSCFSDMRTSIWDLGRVDDEYEYIPLPSKPFIRGIGQVCFNTNCVRLGSCKGWHGRENLAISLAGRGNYWEPNAKAEKLSAGFAPEAFGYDPTLEDQRMNHLYFELHRPLFIRAFFKDRLQADGRMFVHFYPSGFVAILFGISLKPQLLQNQALFLQAINEIQPWRSHGQWTWKTRLGTGKLHEIVELFRENVYGSIYTGSPRFIKEADWHSVIKLVTIDEAEELAKIFLKGHYNTLEFGPYDPEGNWDSSYQDDTLPSECLLASKHRIVYGMSPLRSRKSARSLFWKLFALHEFVMIKNSVYEDYVEFFRPEIMKLKEFRLSTLQKLTREDILRFSVYDPQIPRYLMALDKHIRSVSSFYRRVYSLISQATGFDIRREKLMILTKEWETEVEQWEHGLSLIWKRVISPLRSLLGSAG